ncbi:MAG: VWA domain-containing protein [Rubrivivax sp.]|nr:VWA domain-containing protein [Rubrivivax sp.]
MPPDVEPKGAPTKLKGFAAPEPRPLPVIVLADTSGSMSVNGKIDALNEALKSMILSFGREGRLRAEIQVGLITFGGDAAQAHVPLVGAHRIDGVQALVANGRTPMGAAFAMARQWLEDKNLVPSRAYRPVLVLVSDGAPTDDWQEPLEALKTSERGQKATRFAMAIGADADRAMLRQFTNDLEAPVFEADGARDIVKFFRAVTMSVVARSTSGSPNTAKPLNVGDDQEDDLDLDAL